LVERTVDARNRSACETKREIGEEPCSSLSPLNHSDPVLDQYDKLLRSTPIVPFMDHLPPHASTSSLVLPTPSSPSPAPPPSSRLEEYLLLLLSDSNLPTGGFVASSGLESFDQHGYISSLSKEVGLVEFVKKSLDNYSKVNGEIVKRSWGLLEEYKMNSRGGKGKGKEVLMEEEDRVIEELLEVDRLCTAMILNQISSRASIAQGNALLSLYSRALAPSSPGYEDQGVVEVVERIRRDVRGAKGGWKGNQSTAFGIVMSATGLSLGTLSLIHTLQSCCADE